MADTDVAAVAGKIIGNDQMVEAGDPVVTVSPVRTSNMAPYLVRVIA